jgi:uncharacterized protein involved in response to NO
VGLIPGCRLRAKANMAPTATEPSLNPPIFLRRPEERAARLLTVYILSGLIFLLLPGTFLGVWNLITISREGGSAQLSSAWIQAHGHAQIFGWIGSFILGIGFYSLPRMRGRHRLPATTGWVAWALWTSGVWLRWLANVYSWNWSVALPLSAILELLAFLLFFRCMLRHKRQDGPVPAAAPQPVWILAVLTGTIGFLVTIVMNAFGAFLVAAEGSTPAFPAAFDARFLAVATFGFIVPTIWGFSARWVPVFLGLAAVRPRWLKIALLLDGMGVALELLGFASAGSMVLLASSGAALFALRLLEPPVQAAKILGVHSTFPSFVRVAYSWLLIAAAIGVAAQHFDYGGGFRGAARHALTVGFFSTMVFAIGQRVLPAFSGMKLLFSPRIMFAALALLNLGCVLRVSNEILAYEHYALFAWKLLPVSACLELAAMSLFAANLVLSFASQPPHERVLAA